jgi:hypothetical protein
MFDEHSYQIYSQATRPIMKTASVFTRYNEFPSDMTQKLDLPCVKYRLYNTLPTANKITHRMSPYSTLLMVA